MEQEVRQIISFEAMDGTQVAPQHDASILFKQFTLYNDNFKNSLQKVWPDPKVFSGFDVPQVDGLLPECDYVLPQTVAWNSNDTIETVKYDKFNSVISINILDLNTSQILKTINYYGMIGQKANIDLDKILHAYQKQGYVLDATNYTEDMEFLEANQAVVINMKHLLLRIADSKMLGYMVKPDDIHSPVWKGDDIAEQSNFVQTREIYRTINYRFEKKSNSDIPVPNVDPIKQEVVFEKHRKAIVDMVTGIATFEPWGEFTPEVLTFEEYKMPVFEDWKPKTDIIGAQQVRVEDSDIAVDAIYHDDENGVTVRVIDIRTNGIIMAYSFFGKAGRKVPFNLNTALIELNKLGYRYLEGQSNWKDGITFKENIGKQIFQIVVDQDIKTITEPILKAERLRENDEESPMIDESLMDEANFKQVVKKHRRITYKADSRTFFDLPQPLQQNAEFIRYRQAKVNLVTAEVTWQEWGKWQPNEVVFNELLVNNFEGFEVTPTSIPEIVVTPDFTNEDIVVQYKALLNREKAIGGTLEVKVDQTITEDMILDNVLVPEGYITEKQLLTPLPTMLRANQKLTFDVEVLFADQTVDNVEVNVNVKAQDNINDQEDIQEKILVDNRLMKDQYVVEVKPLIVEQGKNILAKEAVKNVALLPGSTIFEWKIDPDTSKVQKLTATMVVIYGDQSTMEYLVDIDVIASKQAPVKKEEQKEIKKVETKKSESNILTRLKGMFGLE